MSSSTEWCAEFEADHYQNLIVYCQNLEEVICDMDYDKLPFMIDNPKVRRYREEIAYLAWRPLHLISKGEFTKEVKTDIRDKLDRLSLKLQHEKMDEEDIVGWHNPLMNHINRTIQGVECFNIRTTAIISDNEDLIYYYKRLEPIAYMHQIYVHLYLYSRYRSSASINRDYLLLELAAIKEDIATTIAALD